MIAVTAGCEVTLSLVGFRERSSSDVHTHAMLPMLSGVGAVYWIHRPAIGNIVTLGGLTGPRSGG